MRKSIYTNQPPSIVDNSKKNTYKSGILIEQVKKYYFYNHLRKFQHIFLIETYHFHLKFNSFQIRRNLGDFAVPISVAIMIGIDQAFPSAYVEKLNVPDGLELTSPDKRDWFINPMGIKENVPVWIPFVSCLPAILVYLLLFMETSISE